MLGQAEKTVLIMAGGTGGHVFPALAVAEELQSRGVHIEWLGTEKGIESTVVPNAGIAISYITIEGVRGKGIVGLLKAPLLLVGAIFQAMKIIQQVKPVSVLGMGGFASGPGGVASWLLRKPLVIHEQNAVAGTTNKLLQRFANIALQAFPGALAGAKQVGNPVRKEISALPDPVKRFAGRVGKLKLLVLGGSLGAAALNTIVPSAIALIDPANRPEVWHQTGRKNLEQAEQVYREQGVEARIVPFIEDMSSAYAWADFIICRAGALTVAEISAVGIGALYVPFPHAIDDHQTKNAEWIVANKAGFIIQQKELTAEKLKNHLERLSENREELLTMAKNARALGVSNASQVVAQQCLEMSNV